VQTAFTREVLNVHNGIIKIRTKAVVEWLELQSFEVHTPATRMKTFSGVSSKASSFVSSQLTQKVTERKAQT
jgi:phage/plasmid-associated DNA primase